jgi:hypothetical protein
MTHGNGTIPVPALTPAQRLHLEVYGYVVVEGVLSRDEVQVLVDTTYRIEARYRATGELPGPSCHLSATQPDYFRVDNLPHLAPLFVRGEDVVDWFYMEGGLALKNLIAHPWPEFLQAPDPRTSRRLSLH